MPFDRANLELLRAVLDRLIPQDVDPGACEAGVLDYVQKHCSSSPPDEQLLLLGLAQLERLTAQRHSVGFACLGEAEQDGLLSEWEAATEPTAEDSLASSQFFEHLLALAMEGFYADPENGGNRGGVSWRMLGYDPRPDGTRPGGSRRA